MAATGILGLIGKKATVRYPGPSCDTFTKKAGPITLVRMWENTLKAPASHPMKASGNSREPQGCVTCAQGRLLFRV